jgi:hypothetical protein
MIIRGIRGGVGIMLRDGAWVVLRCWVRWWTGDRDGTFIRNLSKSLFTSLELLARTEKVAGLSFNVMILGG